MNLGPRRIWPKAEPAYGFHPGLLIAASGEKERKSNDLDALHNPPELNCLALRTAPFFLFPTWIAFVGHSIQDRGNHD
jgi:hypothetical protein